MSVFEQLLSINRKLELDYEYASAEESDNAKRVRSVAADYLERYAAFDRMSTDAVSASYMAVVRRYVSDIRAFMATGKYPLEIDKLETTPSRCDYDLFLILTILVTRHRCALMEELTQFPIEGEGLVIGVGSGIELNFIGASAGGDAYDLHISSFVKQAFSRWQFHEALYRAEGARYEAIYAIELLEHLDQPYALIAECSKSLYPGGQLVATTATNVPQFDHRFNFVSDEEFEARTKQLGLELYHKRVIPHVYPRMNIGARNVFYVFKKTTQAASA